MSQPFVGEIRIFAGNFAPAGWAFCNGQLLPISENDVLFNLIGTTYGGDGQETFALPDLAGRFPVHMGQGPGISQNYQIGEKAGVETVTLTTQQIPIHNHAVIASTGTGHVAQPQDAVPAAHRDYKTFTDPGNPVAMGAPAMSSTGGNQPHENMPPYLGLNFIISLFGVFPTQ